MMDIERLLKKCIKKDYGAWGEFTRRYSGVITRSVRYKLNKLGTRLSGTEIHDIVQEIFLLIWEKNKLAGIKDKSCLLSWLAIVSINATSNYCRKNVFRTKKNTITLNENPSSGEREAALEQIMPSSAFDTAKNLESGEIRDTVEKEISRLNYKQQLALKFNLYDGVKQKDIAKIMNISEGTVATLIRRAKNRLRERLKKLKENP